MNTCAIRMSDALNQSGDPIRRMPGLFQLAGRTERNIRTGRIASPNLYILRVGDMHRYLDRQYGEGRLIYDAMTDPKDLVNIHRNTQGIIAFVWSGRPREFGASGHVDLFRIWPNGEKPPRFEATCQSECYWWTIGGPMKAYFWEIQL